VSIGPEQFDPERPIIWGDGTAPAGFPSYEGHSPTGNPDDVQVICTYRDCGHKGKGFDRPEMECGPDCPCPCCRMLQGFPQFGCTYGGYDRSKPAAATDPRGENNLRCEACGFLHCTCNLPFGLMI
jgi:hypothetical protein